MNNSKQKTILILVGLFFVTSSLFIFEVLNTRLFSTILAYHFVFLVTSLAILGSGIGSILVFLLSRKSKFFDNRLKSIFNFSFILAFSYLIVMMIIYKLPYIDSFIFYAVISSIPFVFGGIILSLIFKEFQQIGHKLYFADLLGSSIGSIAIIYFMDNFSFIGTLFIVTSLTLVGTIIFAYMIKLKKIIVIPVILLVLLVLGAFNNNFINSVQKNFSAYISSPNTAIKYWKDRVDGKVEIEYTKWDSISRTDVVDYGSENRKTIITDGGASAPMVKYDGDLDEVSYLKDKIEYIPFSFGSNKSSLLIGTGGGEDILLSLLGDAVDIDAVEINPSTIEAVNDYKDFNGDIYGLKNVNLYIEDGRKYISNTDKKYDHIYLGKVFSNVVDNSSAMLSENYIYTKEAYKEYLKKLDDDGKLTFVFNDVRELIKSLNTMIEIFIEDGMNKEDVIKHFVAINSYSEELSKARGGSIYMPIVIYKSTSFTDEEINKVKEFAKVQNRDIIHLPGEEELPIYKQFANGSISYNELVNRFQFNAEPTTDNNPFFYDYDKGIPDKLLYLLIGVLSAGLIVFFSVFQNKGLRKVSLYFGTIGLGFMLVEMPLIQKAILFIGSTTRAFTFILFSLLLSSGIGSFISSSKIINRINKKRDYIFLIIVGLNIIVNLALPFVFDTFSDASMISKFFIVSLVIFPLGLFLGMPFPRGIESIRKITTENGVPLAQGINSIMSVVSSTLALIISMKLGFNQALILGTCFYIVLFIKNPLRS
ncbi:hypothetical protein [Dethiothermospora halolimnae]|uniref:hypothetical protein n=1 Tax=Dethiothermospora halolimnae TaxID=3114390 RepID=UPI003CCBCB0C